MEFVWNDGGRSASGFVGLAGDCVTRAIAVATGGVYRSIYDALGKASLKTPRNGVTTDISAAYLQQLGWQGCEGHDLPFRSDFLPKGTVIVSLAEEDGRGRHFCAVIDHVIHDTWNAADDENYVIKRIWTFHPSDGQSASLAGLSTASARATGHSHSSQAQVTTQFEFEKILKRLRALDNTATNEASTEGEKHNALRMMQSLMLRHNLTRDDIVDDDNVDNVQFTRMACPVNGRKACRWESMLSSYVAKTIFPTVQSYRSSKGNRTFFWFYGPRGDVENTIALFREMLLTIATAAVLRYGGYTRGSGASYAEGYVSGLPRTQITENGSHEPASDQMVSERALIHTRTLALHQAAADWLELECNVRLVMGGRSGRSQYDDLAASRGRQDGASHQVDVPTAPKRISGF